MQIGIVAAQVRAGRSGSHEPYVDGLLKGLVTALPETWRVELFTSAPSLHRPIVAKRGDAIRLRALPAGAAGVRGYLRRLWLESSIGLTSHCDVLLYTGTSIALIASRPQVSVIHWDTRHTPNTGAIVNRAGNEVMMRLIRRRAAAVIAPTQVYADFLCRAWRFPRQRLNVVHHGAPLVPLRVAPCSGTGTCVAIVNDFAYKTLPELLQAWQQVLCSLERPLLLVLVGQVSNERLDESGTDWRRMQRLGGLKLTSSLSHGEVLDLLGRSELLVSSSSSETFCMPLAEAMACGVPVVSTAIPAAQEVCGPVAVYARTGDASSLAEAMTRVLANPELQAGLSRSGQARMQNWTWHETAVRTLAVLEKAAATRHAFRLL
jgi:glycosyltransferase involved in cell wall biosynthesis